MMTVLPNSFDSLFMHQTTHNLLPVNSTVSQHVQYYLQILPALITPYSQSKTIMVNCTKKQVVHSACTVSCQALEIEDELCQV